MEELLPNSYLSEACPQVIIETCLDYQVPNSENNLLSASDLENNIVYYSPLSL